MAGENGQQQETPLGLSALVVIRFWPGGWTADWRDCDLHQALEILRAVLTELEAKHETEHVIPES